MKKPGCYNRTRKSSYVTQDGWREYDDQHGRPVKAPVWVRITDVMTKECVWSKDNAYKGCNGCIHKAK